MTPKVLPKTNNNNYYIIITSTFALLTIIIFYAKSLFPCVCSIKSSLFVSKQKILAEQKPVQ